MAEVLPFLRPGLEWLDAPLPVLMASSLASSLPALRSRLQEAAARWLREAPGSVDVDAWDDTAEIAALLERGVHADRGAKLVRLVLVLRERERAEVPNVVEV